MQFLIPPSNEGTEPMPLWGWWIILCVLVFGWCLINSAFGSSREIIGGILAIASFGLCIIIAILHGWKWGIISLIGCFAGQNLFLPITREIVRARLGYADYGVAFYRDRELARAKREIWLDRDDPRIRRREKKENRHRENTVRKAVQRDDIREVMAFHNASSKDLFAFYEHLKNQSLPPHLREVVMSNPAIVNFYLSNSTPEDIDGKYLRNIDSIDVFVTLTNWTVENPFGEKPYG